MSDVLAVWNEMALETNTAVRGTPSMNCLRVLACSLVIALAFLKTSVHAAAHETASHQRRATRKLAQEVELPAGMQTSLMQTCLGQHYVYSKWHPSASVRLLNLEMCAPCLCQSSRRQAVQQLESPLHQSSARGTTPAAFAPGYKCLRCSASCCVSAFAVDDFVIENCFIVVLREDAGDAAAAADALVQRVQAALNAAAGATAAAATTPADAPGQLDEAAFDGAAQAAAHPGVQSVRVLRTLGSSSSRAEGAPPPSDAVGNTPSNEGTVAAAASASETSSSSEDQDSVAPDFEALLLAAPPSAMEHIRRQTGLVSAVFRDRVVLSQSRMLRRSLSSSSTSEASEQVLADVPDAAAASELPLGQQQEQQQQPQQQGQALQQDDTNQELPSLSQQAASTLQPQPADDQQQLNASDAQLEAQLWGSTRDNNDSPFNRGSVPSSPLQPITFAPSPPNNRPLSRPNRRRRSAPRPPAPDDDRLDALQRLRTGPEPAPTPAPAPAPVPRPVAPDNNGFNRNPVVNQMKQMLRRQGLAAGEQVPAGIAFIEAATAEAVPYTGGAMQGIQQQVGG
jgi:hypothetical protein